MTSQQMQSILKKFSGTPEQIAEDAAEEDKYKAWRKESGEMEQEAYERLESARDAGDEVLAQQIIAEFNVKRDEIERKHGYKV